MINIDKEIVPFGKHKDKPISSLLADHKYLEWCKNNHVLDKYPKIYNIVYCLNTNPSNSQDSPSPEHNRLQNMFLDKDIQCRLVKATIISKWLAFLNSDEEYVKMNGKTDDISNECILDRLENIKFEEKYNWDIVLTFKGISIGCGDNVWFYPETSICCELKPVMGDDYPSILRQMNRQIELTKHNVKQRFSNVTCPFASSLVYVLIINDFASEVATLDEVKFIFKQHNISVITLNDLVCNALTNSTRTVQDLETENAYLKQLLAHHNIKY